MPLVIPTFIVSFSVFSPWDLCTLSIGLRLSDEAMSIAVARRAEHVSLTFVSVVRQSTLEVCTVWPAKRQLQLHSQMNDIIWMAVKMAQITAVKEPTGLLRSDDKRPDVAILIPWVKGKTMA